MTNEEIIDITIGYVEAVRKVNIQPNAKKQIKQGVLEEIKAATVRDLERQNVQNGTTMFADIPESINDELDDETTDDEEN